MGIMLAFLIILRHQAVPCFDLVQNENSDKSSNSAFPSIKEQITVLHCSFKTLSSSSLIFISWKKIGEEFSFIQAGLFDHTSFFMSSDAAQQYEATSDHIPYKISIVVEQQDLKFHRHD